VLVFFGLRKLACALKAGALLPHSKVIEERAFESVRDKFSDFIVLEPNQKYLKFPGHVILNLFQDLTKLDQWVRC
jgi:hypothetical protein